MKRGVSNSAQIQAEVTPAYIWRRRGRYLGDFGNWLETEEEAKICIHHVSGMDETFLVMKLKWDDCVEVVEGYKGRVPPFVKE